MPRPDYELLSAERITETITGTTGSATLVAAPVNGAGLFYKVADPEGYALVDTIGTYAHGVSTEGQDSFDDTFLLAVAGDKWVQAPDGAIIVRGDMIKSDALGKAVSSGIPGTLAAPIFSLGTALTTLAGGTNLRILVRLHLPGLPNAGDFS